MGTPYRHTTFAIKDDNDYLNMTIAAKRSNLTFIDFSWKAVKEKAEKILQKTDSLQKWQGITVPINPPSDPFDLESWKDYLKNLDKSEWKKFDQLINKLARLSDTKRSELRRDGKL